MKKVESLNSHAETLKLNKTKTQGEIKKLQLQLNKKSEEVRDYQDKLDTMIKSTEELTLQSELKDNSYKELEERFETFKTIYNNDRSKLNIKIKKLEGELEQAKQQQQQQHVIHQQIQAPPLGADSPSLRRLGSYGFNESPTSNLHRNFGSRENSFVVDSTLSEVKFGESCTTPSISRDASAFYLNGDGDDSEHSFTTENGADGMEAGEDALTYMERNSISHSLNNSNSNNNTNNNSSNNNNHNNNIQLISKMSSNIRRLEIELNTLKSENAHLSNEKELIQQEIIAKIKIEDEIHALREQSLQLIQKLEQKEEKEQTMLEIIGEKTEQVEELKADVVDLKDICRLQVQQMIEMKQN